MNKIEAQQEVRKTLVGILSQLAQESPAGFIWAFDMHNPAGGTYEASFRGDGEIKIWDRRGFENSGQPISANNERVPLSLLVELVNHYKAPAQNYTNEDTDSGCFQELLDWAAQTKRSLKP